MLRKAGKIYYGKADLSCNAATTKTRPEVVEAMLHYFTEYYGNPSSVYTFSAESKKAVTNAREIIAKSLGAKPMKFTLQQAEAN